MQKKARKRSRPEDTEKIPKTYEVVCIPPGEMISVFGLNSQLYSIMHIVQSFLLATKTVSLHTDSRSELALMDFLLLDLSYQQKRFLCVPCQDLNRCVTRGEHLARKCI